MHTDNSEVKSHKFPAQLGHKTMDKSCQVYGNFHVGNHNMIAGRRAYIAVRNQYSKPVSGITGRRMPDVD